MIVVRVYLYTLHSKTIAWVCSLVHVFNLKLYNFLIELNKVNIWFSLTRQYMVHIWLVFLLWTDAQVQGFDTVSEV